jgi:hypothetical protein
MDRLPPAPALATSPYDAEALQAAARVGGLDFLGPPLKVSAPHTRNQGLTRRTGSDLQSIAAAGRPRQWNGSRRDLSTPRAAACPRLAARAGRCALK